MTSAKLADASVTQTKLAQDVVAMFGVEDGSITAAKIADGAVGTVQLASGLELRGPTYIADNAFVGISECNYSMHALHVAGTVFASGGYFSLSDERYKRNLSKLSGPDVLSRMRDVNGYAYDVYDAVDAVGAKEARAAARRDIGVLASELGGAFPEAVSTSPEGVQSVAYANLAAVFIEAIKCVDARVRALEEKTSVQFSSFTA